MDKEKMPAANVQFGASGGVVSSDTEQVTSSFALVRALPMPPPAAKLLPRCGQVRQCTVVYLKNMCIFTGL